jgi:ribonuclease BN (tRNA processing enzyme)
MQDGINVRVLGDSGPWSKAGKSIGYLITVGESSYLLDCGAELFNQIGGYGLKDINGLIITHCHDDHKRWFTDLAIFYRYAKDIDFKVPLMTCGEVNRELCRMAEPALNRTLSDDSKRIIDIPCEEYIDYRMIGPISKYRIIASDEGKGKTRLCVVDNKGRAIGPNKAKIVISNKTLRPRMLFRDPVYNEWVEPESFYSFASETFYEKDKNIHAGKEGFTIEAIKAHVWHGIPTIGIRIKTAHETLIFSSDTVHDVKLWEELYTEKREQNFTMTRDEFESSTVIYGDINDYIERTWSEERYREAVNTFTDAIVIHDVSVRDSVVHTSYNRLGNTVLEKNRTILTHSPDRITSEWALCSSEKKLRVVRDRYFEVVEGTLYPMNADIYHKEDGRYFVGYKNEDGLYTVYKKDGMHYICSENESLDGERLYRVDMYEDISGRYFPKLEEENQKYAMRKDGHVELVEYSEQGSSGKVVHDCRKELAEKYSKVAEEIYSGRN